MTSTYLRRRERMRRAEVHGGRLDQAETLRGLTGRYGERCFYCGAEGVPLTVDHVQPLMLDGTHHPDNLRPACHPCNASKGPKRLWDWARDRLPDLTTDAVLLAKQQLHQTWQPPDPERLF